MEPALPPPTTELSTFALLRRLLAMSWRYRLGCIKVIVLQIALLGLGLTSLSLTGVGIDYIRIQLQPSARTPRWPFGLIPPSEWQPLSVIAVIAVGVLLFAVCRAFLNYACLSSTAQLVQQQIVVQLRAQVYDKLQRLSFRFFDENASGSIINRVTRDVQATRMFIDGVIMQSIILLLSLVVYVIYMTNIHLWLTMACLATTPLLWIVTAVFSRTVRPAYLRNRELVDSMVLAFTETIQGVRVIKGFAREDTVRQRFMEANRAVRDQNRWIFGRVSRFGPSIGFIAQMNLVILLAFGGYLVINGALALGSGLVVFVGLLQQFSAQVANIANIANSLQESLSGARRVFEVLDTPIQVRSPATPVPLARARGAVEFKNVTFGYDASDEPVLHGVSFTVVAGQCVAILGATGAGKSTLMSLIPRFYDPQQGSIKVDGVDVRSYDIDALRRNVGMVFQENFLFSNTIRANIAFGAPQATLAQVEQAARIAAAHDFISGLPKGYDTVLGEGGADLSGGQRQRLAIARALLLEPAILLLDDPTAAIDPETEQDILDAMHQAMQGRTTFVVAHRISTLRRADFVVVLDHGRVVQLGTHAQLVNTAGPYRHVAMLQVVDDEGLRMSNR